MTSVGIPMFLAGEEFGDVHDTDYNAVDPKQQDRMRFRFGCFRWCEGRAGFHPRQCSRR
jgi:hypothetical protein